MNNSTSEYDLLCLPVVIFLFIFYCFVERVYVLAAKHASFSQPLRILLRLQDISQVKTSCNSVFHTQEMFSCLLMKRCRGFVFLCTCSRLLVNYYFVVLTRSFPGTFNTNFVSRLVTIFTFLLPYYSVITTWFLVFRNSDRLIFTIFVTTYWQIFLMIEVLFTFKILRSFVFLLFFLRNVWIKRKQYGLCIDRRNDVNTCLFWNLYIFNKIA